jgi:hypothetical protein
MADNPVWVIPAITASASLLGTIVGGLVAYWTSKRMHDRTTAVEELRRKNAFLREGAIQFMSGIAQMTAGGAGLERISERWGPQAARLVAAGTEDQLLAVAREIAPGIEAGGGRMEILLRVIRKTGVLDERIKPGMTVLSELRLVAPGDVVESAQRVLYSAFAQELTTAVAPHLRTKATAAFNSAVNEFFNRVRHHMSVEDIEFDFINEKVMSEALDFERS